MVNPAVGQIDLNLLLVFDTVARERSVTRAARHLGLSVSAVSHALGRLRERLKDPLFLRTSTGLVLTSRAAELEPTLRTALGQIEQALRSTERFDPRRARRVFHVGLSDDAGVLLAPPLMEQLARRASGVDLVFAGHSEPIERALATGGLDLVIQTIPHEGTELYTRVLFEDRFVCLVRQHHPALGRRGLTLESFLALPHVLVSMRGQRAGIVDRELRALGLERRIHCVVAHFSVAPHVVARTDCVLTVPERIARVFARNLGLRIIEPPLRLPSTPLRVYWHGSTHHDPGNRWLRTQIGELARGL